MNIKRGDIFWIELSKYRPAVGSVQKPGRPGIVVSNDANNACANTVEIVYLTCKQKTALPTHCAIESTGKPSLALCEQITTVSTEQLRDYIGQCTEEEMAEIDRCLTISLGLAEIPDDFLKAIQEITTVPPGEAIYVPLAEIEEMKAIISRQEKALAVANARADLLQQMYDNLLILTMNKE